MRHDAINLRRQKISHVVSDKGSRAFGFLASPDMLATAAAAHWREGVVAGAVRHLDMMLKRRAELKEVGWALQTA